MRLAPDSLAINRLQPDLISTKLTHTSGQSRAYLPIETPKGLKAWCHSLRTPLERLPLCLLDAILGRKRV